MRKMSVNVGKSNVSRVTMRVNVNDIDITLNGIRMEDIYCFRYLGAVLYRGWSSCVKHVVQEEVSE
jgi:hypothetical protein